MCRLRLTQFFLWFHFYSVLYILWLLLFSKPHRSPVLFNWFFYWATVFESPFKIWLRYFWALKIKKLERKMIGIELVLRLLFLHTERFLQVLNWDFRVLKRWLVRVDSHFLCNIWELIWKCSWWDLNNIVWLYGF